MIENHKPSLVQWAKNLVIGGSRNPQDAKVFHNISLIAMLAWIGLGADGLSSSCYGPQEAFLALNGHNYLSLFVALGTALTIFVITSSYAQVVELFPNGGGGYLVASKLLSPSVGMISGCALLIDYVLTITVSIAGGADAIFSLLPVAFQPYRLYFAVFMVIFMMLINMRGAKESIVLLAPIFFTFLLTHVFIIIYALSVHIPSFSHLAASTVADMHSTVSQVGLFGMLAIMLRAYSMGAGTYTGIEAVSNGMPVLRDPKVRTAKHTMRYMAFSLAFVVIGLMLAYLFYEVTPEHGRTLNAILFQKATLSWGIKPAYIFIVVALVSEAALLFVAAQAGFLGGPRVLGNMASDRWFPVQFSTLSDRLVTQNGIVIFSILTLCFMILSHGSVRLLVVLYSINVFITFVLSQLGLVRHWWNSRAKVKKWGRKLLVSGIGLLLTAFILVSMVVVKFNEGGWITLIITSGLVFVAVMIKRHYLQTMKLLHRLNSLVSATELSPSCDAHLPVPALESKAKTAVVLVNGFNGMGLHTLFSVIRLFSGVYKNFVFFQVGVVDVGNFKGAQEVERLEAQVKDDLARYIKFMNCQGFYAEGFSSVGVDVVEEANKVAPQILERFPNAVFFAGQLIFPKDSFMLRLLHNHTVFALQKRLYQQGTPFVILPIRVDA